MVVVGRLPQRWPGAVVIEWGAKQCGAMAAIGHLDLRRRLRGSRRTHTQRAKDCTTRYFIRVRYVLLGRAKELSYIDMSLI